MSEPTLADALRRALPCNVSDCPNVGSLYDPNQDPYDGPTEYLCAMHAPTGRGWLEDVDRALISNALGLPELSNPRFLDQLTTEDLDNSAPWNAQGYS